MTKLERLRHEALRSCEDRGHKMSRFKTHDYWKKKRYAHCIRCGKGVVINSYPARNEIDIMGWAVALSCRCLVEIGETNND